VKVTAAGDTVRPIVNITAPAAGATVSGTFLVKASATDNIAVAGVRFFDGAAAIGPEDTSAPFEAAWNTTLVSGGSHVLTAVARDAAGNTDTSDAVGVIVSNVTTVAVPDVVGLTQAAAETAITGAVLTVGPVTSAYNATVPAGEVVSQSPAATTNVAANSAVTFTVSLGPAPAPPAGGLVLALSFDEATGTTATDASGHANHGTIAGAIRVPAQTGFGSALSFDGSNDMVTVADSASLDLATGLTVEAWVKPAAITGWETVVLKERGTGNMAYALYAADGTTALGGADGPAGYANIGSVHRSVRQAAGLPLGAWTHVAVTYDGATQRLYVNGSAVASRPQTGSILVSANPLRIGGNNAWAGEFFAGLIDDVRIYNRALSGAEIGADMNTPVGGEAAPATVIVPDVVGLAAAAALTEITDADLTAGATLTAYSASVPAGQVISQNPAPDAEVAAGTAVAITVSLGPQPAAAGPVLALAFNEAGGSAANDSSGHANHGTVAGATRAAGQTGFGTALSFDGVNDWVTVADSATLDLTTGLTIEAWVNPAAINGWETVVLKERGVGNLAYGFYAADGTAALGGVDGPAGYANIGGVHRAVRRTAGLPLGAWTHVATTFDGATQRLYVNGVLAASRAQTGSMTASASPLRIGGNNAWAGEFFQGLIDEVRVYNRALSAIEIATDMNTPIP
jgi:hypothetical protein